VGNRGATTPDLLRFPSRVPQGVYRVPALEPAEGALGVRWVRYTLGMPTSLRALPPVLFTAFLALVAIPARGDQVALGVLLNGIPSLPARTAVPALASFGEGSFVVAAGSSDTLPTPTACASRWRNGRVVAFGNRSVVEGSPESARLLTNAVRWCAGDHRGSLVAVVGGAPAPDGIEADGHKVARWSVDDLRQRMEAPDFEVVVVDASVVAERDGKRMSEFLTAFVKGGGGLIVVGNQPAQSAAGSVTAPSLGRLENRMLAPMGIGWTGGVATPGDRETWSIDGALLQRACSRRALQSLWDAQMRKAEAPANTSQAVATVTGALLAASREEGWFTARVARFVERWASRRPAPWGPDQPADKLRAVLAWRRTVQTPPPPGKPVLQPGNPFPAVPRVSGNVAAPSIADIRVPGGFTGILPTGLAALPGERIAVIPPAGNPALRIRVGEHPPVSFASDTWERFPEIRTESEVTAGKSVVPVFGGPISLVIERSLGVGDTHVRIIGANTARIDDGFVPGPLWRESVRGPVRLLAPPGVAVPPDSPNWDQARKLATSIRRAVRPGLPEPNVLALDPAGVATDRWVGIPLETWELLRRPESAWSRLAFAEAVAAAAPGGAASGWQRLGTVVAAVAGTGDPLPETQSSERNAARAQAATGGRSQNPSVLLEMVLQIRETIGAAAFDVIRSRVSVTESNPVVWWTVFGEATGKDLRPHWKAFGLPLPTELESRSTDWQPWTGTISASTNASVPPGQP